mmetsp:Transcript_125600/g.268036  ORF Transcript_125600/g.268036 Transcript_125600/m.268036 type:complete len:295 (+) Transcript_125600:80-964(+)
MVASSDKQPAKIAKYLLKGYCLLNEYCPNGQNVPLVRSRDGKLICCCSDSTCPYTDEPAAPVCTPADAAPAAVPATAPQGAESKAAPALAPVLGGGAAASATPPAAPATSPAVSATSPAQAWTEEATAGSHRGAANVVEITLQGPEFKFSCVRVATGTGERRSRLLGGSFDVKVRLAVPLSRADTGGLKEAVSVECRRLAERVLVPERAGVKLSRAAGQVLVACEDGVRFQLPEEDCLVLPIAGTTQAELAGAIWEAVAASSAAGSLRSCGAQWMEVSVGEASSGDASYRRAWA